MHSIGNKTIIGMPEELVYGNSESGKLEETDLFKSMFSPHQIRFDCDGEACLPIAIHHLPAFALEECVGFAMPAFSHSTAVATPFRGVVGINNVESNVLVEASAFEIGSELVEGDTQNFTIEILSLTAEPLEVFNADVSIIFQSQVGDVSYDFSNSVLDEVLFTGFEQSELSDCFMASFISVALEQTPTTENLFTLNPNVFPIVELLEDSAIGSQDRDCEALAVHINTNHVPAGCCNYFFAEEGDYLPVCGESVGLTSPTSLNQRSVSLVVPVLADGNGNRFSGVGNKLDEQVAFSFKSFAVSRHVELDCDVLENSSFGSDYAPFNIADYLTSKGGGFFGS